MAVLSGGNKLDATLAELARKIGTEELTLNVGFLEKATYPDGTPVALVAATQNFGSPAMGIPPRPFFSNAIEINSPGWGAKLGRLVRENNYDTRMALNQMGAGIAGQISAQIDATMDPPLSPVTIQRKGFDKPLIDSGDMRKALEDGNTPWEIV